MRFFDAAADLVSIGFKVFPLVPGDKVPLVKEWQKIASDDPIRSPNGRQTGRMPTLAFKPGRPSARW